jgi:hypothetical protein
MQYDEQIIQALRSVRGAIEPYRSAVGLAAEQLRSYLGTCCEASAKKEERAEAELGEFAAGRINVTRFSALLNDTRTRRPCKAVEEALRVLEELASEKEDFFLAHVEDGGDLRGTIEHKLATVGRAFGAARIVELERSGTLDAETENHLLYRYPFRSWNRSERRLAPPLAVSVDGRDLYAASLAEFMDGATKIILIVRGSASPAPLVRLVAPSTFVMQTNQLDDLAAVSTTSLPAIAALLPEGSARFVHDPSAGRDAGKRLSISFKPADQPRRAIGGISAAQQSEELRLLALLAAAPAPEVVPPSQPNAADPVDVLAAWLLQQSVSASTAQEG